MGTCGTGAYEDQDPDPGEFSLTGLKWGTYTISETAAPPGYTAATGEFAFTQIKGSALEGTLVPVDGVTDNGIINERLVGSVSWRKADADNAEPLSGSTWTLAGPGVPADTVVTDCGQAPCEAGAYKDQDPAPGAFELRGLAWSDQAYSLTEREAPAGYTLDKTVHEFTISPDALAQSFDEAFRNSKAGVPLLPLTGGLGAYLFLIGGAVLCALAMIAAIVRRRRSQTVH